MPKYLANLLKSFNNSVYVLEEENRKHAMETAVFCKYCSQHKLIDQFTASKLKNANPRCKGCVKDYQQDRKNKIKSAGKSTKQHTKEIKAQRAAEKQWRKENPGLLKCSDCGETKALEEFNERKGRERGYYYDCKKCRGIAFQEKMKDENFRSKKRKQSRRTAAKKRQELYDLVLEFKKDKPCQDCGGLFPPYVMDFDHVDPTNKIDTITHLRSVVCNKKLLLLEIAKCELVCSNCHRIRTWDYGWRNQHGMCPIQDRLSSNQDKVSKENNR